jgi:hypothetical protein
VQVECKSSARAVQEQCKSSARAVQEQCKSSARAVQEQCKSSARAVQEQCNSCGLCCVAASHLTYAATSGSSSIAFVEPITHVVAIISPHIPDLINMFGLCRRRQCNLCSAIMFIVIQCQGTCATIRSEQLHTFCFPYSAVSQR